MAYLENPYDGLVGGTWLRGNLHTHTTVSDGQLSLQQTVNLYAGFGHDFLALTDHEILIDPAGIAALDSRGMILVPGYEVAGGPHVVHLGAHQRLTPTLSRQEIFNAVPQAGGLVIVAHPDWLGQFDHATIEQLREWTGYAGMEIYNGGIEEEDGSCYALSKWDMLLAAGRRVWGFANDDCHNPAKSGRGWNVVYVTDRSAEGIVDALKKGRFYASTGVTIRSIQVEGLQVRIEAEDADRILAIGATGKRLAMADGNLLELRVPDSARYVRFECLGRRQAAAWTQPMFVHADAKSMKALSFLDTWNVSPRMADSDLADVDPVKAATRCTMPVQCRPFGHILEGFVDLRPQIEAQPGVVFLRTTFRKTAGRGILKLGYDGPIRIWLNGKAVFHGPGTNPAVLDKMQFFVDFREGENEILIAMNSNGGKAWGLFARAETPGRD